MPLQEEERLFIDAMRDLNYQASRLQSEENETITSISDASEYLDGDERKNTGHHSHPRHNHVISLKPIISQDFPIVHHQSITEPSSTVFELDTAADAALLAASKLSHSDSTSTDLKCALAWMTAITQKPNQPNDISDNMNAAQNIVSITNDALSQGVAEVKIPELSIKIDRKSKSSLSEDTEEPNHFHERKLRKTSDI
jgi:hypothetical protein